MGNQVFALKSNIAAYDTKPVAERASGRFNISRSKLRSNLLDEHRYLLSGMAEDHGNSSYCRPSSARCWRHGLFHADVQNAPAERPAKVYISLSGHARPGYSDVDLLRRVRLRRHQSGAGCGDRLWDELCRLCMEISEQASKE